MIAGLAAWLCTRNRTKWAAKRNPTIWLARIAHLGNPRQIASQKNFEFLIAEYSTAYIGITSGNTPTVRSITHRNISSIVFPTKLNAYTIRETARADAA